MDIYENVGKALCVSLLDIIDKNSKSRVYNSPFGNIDVNNYYVCIFILENEIMNCYEVD